MRAARISETVRVKYTSSNVRCSAYSPTVQKETEPPLSENFWDQRLELSLEPVINLIYRDAPKTVNCFIFKES